MPKCSDCGFLNQTIVGFKMEVDNEPSYSCLKGLTPHSNISYEWDCEGYIKYTPGINDYFKYEEELKKSQESKVESQESGVVSQEPKNNDSQLPTPD